MSLQLWRLDMLTIIYIIAVGLVSLLLAHLVRKYAPATLINGYMDYDKAAELAPEIFKKEKE
jgi:hypothetical protein